MSMIDVRDLRMAHERESSPDRARRTPLEGSTRMQIRDARAASAHTDSRAPSPHEAAWWW
jgi:hypothetical protein